MLRFIVKAGRQDRPAGFVLMAFDAQAMAERAVVAPAAMARADARTIANGTPQLTLVERAARACFRVLRARYPRQLVTLLCGPGHNGEDGLVLARMLSEAGWPIEVMLLDSETGLDEERFGALNAHLRPTGVFAPVEGDLVVDALFGAGLSRPLEGEALALVQRLNASGATVLAVDLPSGIDGATGEVLGDAPVADASVTFHRLKPGHLVGEGAARAGKVFLSEIGVVHNDQDTAALWNHPSLWRGSFPRLDRETHKYRRGGVAVVGGPGLRGGAARLSARAAAVSGAGAVTFLSPISAAEYAAARFDAVMVRRIADAESLKANLSEKTRAVVIGPGMGHGEASAARLETVLASGLDCVVDADALTLHADRPERLIEQLHGSCVLTPHEGEFARLFPDLTGDRLSRAQEAAERTGAVVLIKGATTVIAAPGERPVLNTQAGPALATAGSGDCLAGVIGAFLAQGLDPLSAAAAGTYVHAVAGRRAPLSLTADDLPARLGDAYAALMADDPKT